MSQNDLPMMPFFIKDWIAATVHLTDAERGAYVSLLAFQWVNGKVPPDVSQLARIMGTPDEEFQKRWSSLASKFDGDAQGLFNSRLEEHRKRSLDMRDSKVRAANAANAVRAAKKAQRNVSHLVPRPPGENAERDAHVTPTSTSLSTSKNQEEEPKKEGEHEREETDLFGRSANAVRVPQETSVPRGGYWSDEKWIDFKLKFPARAGGYDWEGAKKAWRARLRDGHYWEQLFAGADRYNAYCTAAGKIGTEVVMMPKTFCGPGKRFLEEFDLPAILASGESWSAPNEDPPEAS